MGPPLTLLRPVAGVFFNAPALSLDGSRIIGLLLCRASKAAEVWLWLGRLNGRMAFGGKRIDKSATSLTVPQKGPQTMHKITKQPPYQTG